MIRTAAREAKDRLAELDALKEENPGDPFPPKEMVIEWAKAKVRGNACQNQGMFRHSQPMLTSHDAPLIAGRQRNVVPLLITLGPQCFVVTPHAVHNVGTGGEVGPRDPRQRERKTRG